MNPQTDLYAIRNCKRWKSWKTNHNEVRQVALDSNSNHQLPSTTGTSVKRRFFSLLWYATPARTPAATTPEMTTVFVAAWRGVCRALAMTGNGVSRRAAQGSAGAPQHGVVGSISSFFLKTCGNMEGPIRGISYVSFGTIYRTVPFIGCANLGNSECSRQSHLRHDLHVCCLNQLPLETSYTPSCG